jgi:cysteine desulfuration protein SufE
MPPNPIYQDFLSCQSQEEIYQKLIALGKRKTFFDHSWKTEENRVWGCQSLIYLHGEKRQEKLFFYLFSEALISAGLAYLLIDFYQERSPEDILKTPPSFLNDLNIAESLTPGRANGLSSLYLHIKRIALNNLYSK